MTKSILLHEEESSQLLIVTSREISSQTNKNSRFIKQRLKLKVTFQVKSTQKELNIRLKKQAIAKTFLLPLMK